MANRDFLKRIEALIAAVPAGRVTTYGDLAAMAGKPQAARVVGGIAHHGSEDLPWHRLVNVNGGLASGFPGGREAQRQLLEHDGIICVDYYVENLRECRWRP